MSYLDELEELAGPTARLTRRTKSLSVQTNKLINGVAHRRCSRCRTWQALEQNFYRSNRANIINPTKGFQSYCKDCCKLRGRKKSS